MLARALARPWRTCALVYGLLIASFGEPAGTEWEVDPHINLMTWAASLVLIVLAEVFREGARLREEQELGLALARGIEPSLRSRLVIAAESRRVPLLMSCLHGTQVGEVGKVRVVIL